MWLRLLGLLVSTRVQGAHPPDGTGLVGTSPALLLAPDATAPDTLALPQLPLKFWANPRKSALKPRRRDLHETTLLALLGHDFDSRWMKRNRLQPTTNSEDESERKTVRALRALVNNGSRQGGKAAELELPTGLPQEYRELVKGWLVQRATCPIRFVWDDLGPYFWPRWLRRGQCDAQVSCSWPPGMACLPGGARNLHVLRWHCRMRKVKGKKRKSENNVWATSTEHQKSGGVTRRKRRKKYRCLWIKVPYPVPEDCVCSC